MLHNPADFGTSEEAKAMLKKAVAAVKENKAKALDMFNKGEGFAVSADDPKQTSTL